MSARNLTLAFFSPQPGDDWVNRLVARASEFPYCHVELYFEGTNQCFSILWKDTAKLRVKTLQSDCYEIVSLAVSLKEYDACYAFCQQAAAKQIPFDNLGMYMSYFYLPGCGGEHEGFDKKTYCSKIICQALHSAGIEEVGKRYAFTATPSRLYKDIMHSKRRVCASVPYKRYSLAHQNGIKFGKKMYVRLDNVFM